MSIPGIPDMDESMELAVELGLDMLDIDELIDPAVGVIDLSILNKCSGWDLPLCLEPMELLELDADLIG